MDRPDTNDIAVVDEELERRLAAYAEARLGVRAGASARMRTAVLAGTRPVPADGRTGVVPMLSTVRRSRPLLALLAATAALFLVMGGALALGGPGRPLYGIRLWVEEATLPSGPEARAQAQERRLEARLDEAGTAARSGDSGAVADALRAYRDELAAVVAAGGFVGLEERLRTHLVVLEALADRVPTAAQDAIEQAIDRSSRALERLESKDGDDRGNQGGGEGSPPAGGGQGGGQGSPPAGGGQGGGQGGGNQPGQTPGRPSPKPHPSPRPEVPKASPKGANPAPSR